MRPRRWVGPGAVGFLVLWISLLAAGRSTFFRDPGTFWHVATGERVLADGFFRTDPFTFTFAGTWWVPHQWLGDVAMAVAHRVGGFDTVLLGSAALVAAVYAWLGARILRTGLHPVAAGAVVVLGLAASSSHFHARPHLFTIAGTAVTIVLLMDVDGGRAPVRRLWRLVPLVAVWSNVHGGVLGGIATVALAATGWVVAGAVGRPGPVRSWAARAEAVAVVLACGLATLANPYGTDMVRMWYVIMGDPALPEIIQEHSRLDPAEPYAWPVFGLGAAYLALLAGLPWRRVRVSWLLPLVWLVMACDRVRHAPLFGVAALAGVAAVWPHTRWAAWLRRVRPDFYQPPGGERLTPASANVVLPVVAVLGAVVLQAAGVAVPVVGAGWVRHDPRHWPVGLLGALKANEPRPGAGNRLFNDYIDGGFVIYYAPGYKVFVDDRCEVFGGEWLVNFVRAGAVDTAAAVAGWEREYGRFDFALTRAGTGFDAYFRSAPGWVLVERTDTAAFYGRAAH